MLVEERRGEKKVCAFFFFMCLTRPFPFSAVRVRRLYASPSFKRFLIFMPSVFHGAFVFFLTHFFPPPALLLSGLRRPYKVK